MLACTLPTRLAAAATETRPCRRQPAANRPPGAAKDNERPLVDDIRLLGRILGDVIREQEGEEAFELVERIRQLSVAFRLRCRPRGRPGARPPAEEPVAATRR